MIFASQIELWTDNTDEDAYLAGISSRVSDYCHDSICKLMDEAGFPCPDLRQTLRKGFSWLDILTPASNRRKALAKEEIDETVMN